MKEDKYQRKVSGMKFSRVMAWICLVIIGAIVIATFITGITGSEYFYGCLFMCIIVPLLMYVALWIGKVLQSVHDDIPTKNIQDKEEEND